MIKYQPHPVQSAAHKAFLVDGYKRGTLFWGRQVGKSLWSVKHLEIASCYEQGPYHIVFNTHKHAKDVMWRQYLHTIPKDLIADTNSTDLIITFNYIKMPIFIPGSGWKAIIHDQSLPPSTLQLLGSDYADDHRGKFSKGMIFDEYQDQDPNNWESVYKYFFTVTKGWAAFMGTAKGYNHWYEMLEHAKASKRWFYQEATWRDNPLVDKEWIDTERKEAEEKGMLDIFMQEVELQFRTVQGSVYSTFDRNVHVLDVNKPRIPIPEEGTLFATWDFGWVEGHPTAINLVLVDNQGRRFCIDEVHGTELPLDDALDMLRMRVGTRKLQAIIADSARPDLIDVLRSKAQGFAVIPAPKRQNSVPVGIQLLASKLKPKLQLVGTPEPEYYFTSNCKHTIYQFENYRYRENKKDRPVSELPLKIDDDHPDGLRYLELYLKYGLVKNQRPIKNTLSFNQYGLPR